MDQEGRSPGLRERGKEARRLLLVRAAREALEQDDFSMRRVAALAGLSEATPYNLFESKSALLGEVYREECERLLARLESAGGTNTLDRVFVAFVLIAADFDARPNFHRALFTGLFESVTGRLRDAREDHGFTLWNGLLEAAIATGAIVDTVSARAVPRLFIYLIGGATREWIAEIVSTDEWRIKVSHGLALLLLPVASPDSTRILRARLRTLEAEIGPVGAGASLGN
ncbi:TetR/AcrR family transcriptional regulator [Novosphingobium aquimarinum]|uniref:TetR/AcrR family transcriptional regulator n=1 Tax=Novosphingobium aquimarinum TaxID=2682494 RepID=UPI0018DB39BF|nr:TetR/AcrR family transcriptional regulator [Novosphingobium aquimarinum]